MMPVQTINLDHVEKQLAELLAIVEHNGDVVIAQNGKPIARLASLTPKKKKRIAGLNRGMIWTSDDFDAPLPDEFWLGKE
ncbi:MAG: type II toxin-antitoxin system prevent-host-death family antitoxin [Caldilineaceae bacterium]